MLIEKIDEKTTFAYSPHLDAIFSVFNLLGGGKAGKLCADIYGEEQIAVWKKKYPFLLETSAALRNIYPFGIMDFILDMEMDGLDLSCFHDFLKGLKTEDFLWRMLDLEFTENAGKKTLAKALTDDSALDEVYGWVQDRCSSFLPFTALIRQSRRYIDEFFALALELLDAYPQDVQEKQEAAAFARKEEIISNVRKLGAFDYSQKIMGKTFRNRGPYDRFVFIPSYTMFGKSCRFFNVKEEYKSQVLFMSLRNEEHNQEDLVKALKAMGDTTRYQILMLLAKEGTLRGMDIAKQVSIATSTVSHHMEQLKEAGLVTEEQVKNSKYYGLNYNSAASLINELKKNLAIKIE